MIAMPWSAEMKIFLDTVLVLASFWIVSRFFARGILPAPVLEKNFPLSYVIFMKYDLDIQEQKTEC
jgi:hypothetical protein